MIDIQVTLLKPINSPIKNESYDKKYPFTNLGYTCDWYYGDGCRKGLNEFFIKEKNNSTIKKTCTIDDYLDEKCSEYKKL